MTIIGSSPYVTGYANAGLATNTTTTPTNTADTSAQAKAANNATAAVTVTLSAEAQAALKAQTDTRTADGVVAEARSALDSLLKAAKATSALKDGKATIDLAGLDRRELYAIASNRGGKFPIEEQVVTSLELKSRRDAVLAGPAASARITGDYAGLYKAALDHLETASPEEKATGQWAKDKAALTEGRKQAMDRPGIAPAGIEGDPIAAYLKDAGGVVASPRTRDFGKVASDVRAVLDRQYATATAEGMATDPESGEIDFARFDARSLAAISLNRDGLFSEHEIREAATEIRTRDGQAVRDSYTSTGASDDPSAFGKAMIARYVGMTGEERQAAGWTPQLYDQMVKLQDMRSQLASFFSGANGPNGGSSLLDYI